MLRRRLKKPIIEEVIAKGSPVIADINSQDREWTQFCLRLPKAIHNELNKIIKEDRIGMTLNALVLEAVLDKIKQNQINKLKPSP